eukprot:UN10559
MATSASTDNYAQDDTEEFSDDVTTRVSIETSYNVLSNGPEIVDIDNNNVNNVVNPDDSNDEEEKMDHYIITKDDFINDDVSEESSSGEIAVSPESEDDTTEIHHDVLVKLKSDPTQNNEWLINIR